MSKRIYLVQDDLSEYFNPHGSVAIDTETTGLLPFRDRLCLISIANNNEDCCLVQLPRKSNEELRQKAPRLMELLGDIKIRKIFHYARFDMMMLYKTLGVMPNNVICSKIASKLVRTYTERHGLKELCREILGLQLNKNEQSSDWGRLNLSQQQQEYAASDVLYLHKLWDNLQERLQREEVMDLYKSCCDFLPTRVKLDLMGLYDTDILSHG